MVWRIDGPQGNESEKIKYLAVPYTRGIGLDLGCGSHKAFPHFIGIDSGKDTELFGAAMRPDVQIDCANLDDNIEAGSCDFIFSSHLLEHINDYPAALASWWRTLKIGGHLVLYLPDEDEYPRCGEPGANPDHQWNVSYEALVRAMQGVGAWDLVQFEKRNAGIEYSLYFVFRKRAHGAGQDYGWKAKQPAKTACVVRFGGFGDALQASAILPELKRQGFHVTLMVTPKTQDILRIDPHVDDWIVQDEDQVPNHELGAYFDAWRPRFTRFINLCESVEGTLLTMPGRINHTWPDALRHQLCDRNYLEFTAQIANVAPRPDVRFYPTDNEREWARAQRGAGYCVLFALAGSSLHKFYPGQDEVIAAVLRLRPGARFILVGDAACKILECGWENDPRVTCLSGEISIRQTLALAQVADCVVGPETGVLNAVAYESLRKVVLLSHSSHENLTKHWANTAALAAAVPCYPCHRLHYDDRWCRRDEETGAALCQRAIAPERVISAILESA